MLRQLSESNKKRIAGKQYYKCANKPGDNLNGLEGYKCPFWLSAEHNGSFDESGFDIDHIIEYSIGGATSESNLQALCIPCHAVKTKRFMAGKTDKKGEHNKGEHTKKGKGEPDLYPKYNDNDLSIDIKPHTQHNHELLSYLNKLSTTKLSQICELLNLQHNNNRLAMIDKIIKSKVSVDKVTEFNSIIDSSLFDYKN